MKCGRVVPFVAGAPSNVKTAPASIGTVVTTSADPSRVYLYGIRAAVRVKLDAPFVAPPRSLSRATAKLFRDVSHQ